MKRYILTVAALTFSLAMAAPFASAQATSAQPAAAQDPAAEEAAAYKAFYDAYTAKDLAKELELGKVFVEKFPTSKNADYVKKEVSRVRGLLLQQAVTAKNVADIIRLGKEAMAADPNNLDYAIYLTIQLRTIDTNLQNSADIAEFANTAIRLIESGKVPAQKDPPFDKNKTLAYFHNTLGSIDEHNKTADKALEHYHQATMLDPMNAAYFFNCGRLHQDRYVVGAQKYQAFSQDDRTAAEPKPEVKAALDDVNKEADAVINCWARFVALKSDYSEDTRKKVNAALTDLYKYRHNDSIEGLQKLIDDNKTSPTPVSMTPPPVAPAAPPTTQKADDQNAMSAKPGTTPAKPAPVKPTGKKP